MGKLSRELRMSIHNRYDIEVVDMETGEVKQRARAFNVLTNNYYKFPTGVLTQKCGASTGYPGIEIAYGSGSGTPAATDTALFHYEGTATADSTYSPINTIDSSQQNDGIWIRRVKQTIPNTQSVGVTITEVGVYACTATYSSSRVLVSHAMLEDMNGNPISIQHASTDMISVYFTMYLHYEGQDTSDIHLFLPQSGGIVRIALLGLPANSGYGSLSFPSLMQGTDGMMYVSSGYGQDSYPYLFGDALKTAVSDKIVRFNANPQVPIGKGNFTNGVSHLYLSQYNNGQYSQQTVEAIIETGKTSISPAHISDESVGVGDGNTTKFKTKFGFPYNAKVYINGVEVTSGVTVKKAGRYSTTAGSTSALYHAAVTGSSNYPFMRLVSVAHPNLPLPNGMRGSSADSVYITNGGTTYMYEFLEREIGLYNIRTANGNVKGSNDGTTWVDVETSTATTQMNQAGAFYRYYKYTGTGNADISMNGYDGNNIEFTTPPAQGDVITIDYTTDYIPKDSDHVLDVELTFTFGEWTGE